MKKLLLMSFIFMIFNINNFSIAQEQKQMKWGIGVQLNNPVNDIKAGWFDIDNESFDGNNVKNKSFSIGLFGSRTLKEHYLIRLRMAMTMINLTEYTDYYLTGIRYTGFVSGEQFKFHFAPGFGYKINYKKLSIIAGFEIPVNFFQKFELYSTETDIDSINGNIVCLGEGIQTIPKGFSLGIGAIIGFEFFPINNLSFGAEFSPMLLYKQQGGKIKTEYSYTLPSYDTFTDYFNDKNEGLFFYENRISFNIAVWF